MAATANNRLAVIYPLTNMAKFQEELQSAKDEDALLVVMATQPRCMSCKALRPKVDSLARARGDIRFFEVNSLPPAGREICDEIGVEALPTICIYEAGKSVWKSTVTVPQWKQVVRELEDRKPSGQ